MLAYILALVVAVGSLAIYIAAFFFPEIHRKNDFIWSGVGLFYALVLWVFVPRITGGLLLGHIASVALLVWFGWQTFSLRRQLTPKVQQTPIPNPELVKLSIQQQVSQLSLQQRLGKLILLVANVFSAVKGKFQQTVSKGSVSPIEKDAVKSIDQTTVLAESLSQTISEMETPTIGVTEEEVRQTDAKIATVSEAISVTVHGETEEQQSISVQEVVSETVVSPPGEVLRENLPPTEGTAI